MEENKNTITEAEVVKVTEVLEDSLSEKSKLIRELAKCNTVDEMTALMEKYSYDTVTEVHNEMFNGKIQDLPETLLADWENKLAEEGQVDQELEDADNIIVSEKILEDKESFKSISNSMDLSDEDALKLFSIVNRYRGGEKFNVYNELPEKLKKAIKTQAMSAGITNRADLAKFAKMMIDIMIEDSNMDNEIDKYIKDVKKELNIPSITGFYIDSIRETYEVKMLENADKIESENPRSANYLRMASRGFTKAYTMENQIAFLNDDKNLKWLSKMRKHIIRFKRFLDGYNECFSKIKDLKVKNVKSVQYSLKSIFPNLKEYDIKTYTLVLIKCSEEMETNMETTMFKYHSITLLELLAQDQSDKIEFNVLLKNNISQLIELINERINKSMEV